MSLNFGYNYWKCKFVVFLIRYTNCASSIMQQECQVVIILAMCVMHLECRRGRVVMSNDKCAMHVR